MASQNSKVVGLAIAYSTYRCGRSQLISSVFAPIFGRTGGHGVGGRIIDILAIFATLFGTTASLRAQFARHFGISPLLHRRTFRATAASRP